jgi:hypothetical protein
MSSVIIPSVIASDCPTEVTGTPSEIATVKGLPSVCSIATLQETANGPVMTSSDSLHPRGTTEGGTESVHHKTWLAETKTLDMPSRRKIMLRNQVR